MVNAKDFDHFMHKTLQGGLLSIATQKITKVPRSCEAAHEVSKVEAQRGEENITYLLVMDPWSKGDYSRHIREASMAMEGLPKVVPPSGRVPGQLLLAAPILKRRRRRYREEFGDSRSILGVSSMGDKYRPKGGTER